MTSCRRSLQLFVGIVVITLIAHAEAQSLDGTWQGTLKGSKEIRLLFKISKPAPNFFNATLYSIDQGVSVPTAPLVVAGPDVTIDIPGIGATYKGKLGTDRLSMSGVWIQQGRTDPLPLELNRVTGDAVWEIPKDSQVIVPMAPDAKPSFIVSTIKPSKPDAEGKLYKFRGRTFSMSNYSLDELIAFSYSLNQGQVLGGPKWINEDHFDIVAEQNLDGLPNIVQIKSMLRGLLEDRFNLRHHIEEKELSVYLLNVAEGPPTLLKDETDHTGSMNLSFPGQGSLVVHNASMNDFAIIVLQGIMLDRPVLDHTDLEGRYDFKLKWAPTDMQDAGAEDGSESVDGSDDPSDLFTAIREQLNLRLVSAKANAPVLIVDQASKPGVN